MCLFTNVTLSCQALSEGVGWSREQGKWGPELYVPMGEADNKRISKNTLKSVLKVLSAVDVIKKMVTAKKITVEVGQSEKVP